MKSTLLYILFLASFHGYAQPKYIKVLYVGNSLTYANDLPSLITNIAKQDSTTISYTAFAFPDYSLEDH